MQPIANLDKAIDLKHYVRVLQRRRGIILLCAVATLCITAVALHFKPREYESQAILMVEDSRLLSSDLEALTGGILQAPSGYGMDEERLAKLVGRVQSRPFLERVVRMLKADKDPVIRAKAEQQRKKHPEISLDEMAVRVAVGNLQSRIRFGGLGRGVYRVTVADYKAESAQLLAKWITELFVEVSNQSSIDRLKKAHEFGTEQLRIYEDQLRKSEQALERYNTTLIQRSFAGSAVRDDNLAMAEALKRKIDDESAADRIQVRICTDELSRLGLDTEQRAVFEDPGILDLGKRLSDALSNTVAERLAGRDAGVGDWPPSGAHRAVQADLLKEAGSVASTYLGDQNPQKVEAVGRFVFARINLDAEVGVANMLGNAIDSFKHHAEAKPGGEIELKRLETEVETNRKLLQSFQSQLVASDVSKAVEITKLGLQIEILDPATLPLTPTRPNVTKIILAALLLGPVIGIGIAFLTDVTDPTLRTLEDFGRVVPEPVLGTTPLLSRLVTRQRWIRRHWVVSSLIIILALTGLFYLFKGNLTGNLANVGRPVQLVDPQGAVREGD